MDVRLCKEEEFFSFTSSGSFLEEECNHSESPESSHSTVVFDWNSENEKEINGDFSVIPVSGSLGNVYSISPPTKGNWQAWQHLLGPDPDEIFNNEILLRSPLRSPIKQFKSPLEGISRARRRLLSESSESGINELAQSILEDLKPQVDFAETRIIESNGTRNVFSAKRKISLSDIQENFDLNEYVFEKPKVKVESKPVINNKAAVKKIDLEAQKYIVEEEDPRKKSVSEEEGDVDIETVSDTENNPVLEAGDLASLLEQFEATEKEVSNDSSKGKLYVKEDPMETCEDVTDNCSVKWEASVENNIKRELTAIDDKVVVHNLFNDLKHNVTNTDSEVKQVEESLNKASVCANKNELTPTKVLPKHYVHNPNAKKVLDYLPQEVVDRIKESGKRKPITVIDPIVCSKKTKVLKSEVKEEEKTQDTTKITSICHLIQLDHNYCSSPSPIFKKDSGFASSEEEERILVGQQPAIKNADGKVMVSILKANTVHHSHLTNCKIKKLNLEEYKKRRKCEFKSENSSPNESNCSSPLPEDEHERMLRHQEKLRKMAEEVLHAAPKSEKNGKVAITKPPLVTPSQPMVMPNAPLQEEIKLPPNIERKVLVSFGVNTDFKILKGKDPLAPVKTLQEIEPLLEQASDKINEHSLINSLIENLPKVIDQKEKVSSNETIQTPVYEHGENKQVLYLEKDRIKCETKDVCVQTDISLVNQIKRGRARRRISSSSSNSSSCSETSGTSSRNRNSSESSTTSVSSKSSSSSSSSNSSCQSLSRSPDRYSRVSSSRSRSRSISPRVNRKRLAADRDHRSAVEERRIIYVGRIKQGTSKDDLRRKFNRFGPITNVSLHFRDQGENYGFVTFKYKEDAHEAYEKGNSDPKYAEFKISFGGRREFCQNPYADLDNIQDDAYYNSQNQGDSFDNLLREMQDKLKRRRM